ncbi:MAG: hypothetical protein ABSE36_14275 [Terracidiphilus sp.]|jgi:hypothetical protein
MGQKKTISCILGADADLFHIANTVTGLCELEANGLIKLRLRRSSEIGEHAIVLDLGTRTAGIDLWDHSDRILPELQGCDFYFKRCVREENLNSEDRIRLFGLNYACRSWKATVSLLSLFGPTDVVRRRAAWKKFLLVPLVGEFERRPTEPASPTILFQARLWEPYDCPGDEQVNEERIGLLLALRAEFKDRVVGGLVPSILAQKHYRDLLTTLPPRQGKYVRRAREHLISIGFRGLFGSLGFKLAESLAASQCLIYESAASYLPPDVPLARYRNAHECISACDRYLSRPEDAKQLRSLAWEYYQSAVEPGAHMETLLHSIADA